MASWRAFRASAAHVDSPFGTPETGLVALWPTSIPHAVLPLSQPDGKWSVLSPSEAKGQKCVKASLDVGVQAMKHLDKHWKIYMLSS